MTESHCRKRSGSQRVVGVNLRDIEAGIGRQLSLLSRSYPVNYS